MTARGEHRELVVSSLAASALVPASLLCAWMGITGIIVPLYAGMELASGQVSIKAVVALLSYVSWFVGPVAALLLYSRRRYAAAVLVMTWPAFSAAWTFSIGQGWL